MITDTDIKKMKKVFATKDELKDMRYQLLDSMDGKLVKQKEEILEEVGEQMDEKLAKQKEEIVEAVGEYITEAIVPMLDNHDKRIVRIEEKIGLTPLVD